MDLAPREVPGSTHSRRRTPRGSCSSTSSGSSRTSSRPSTFNPASFERNGIALLPYAARDPELTRPRGADRCPSASTWTASGATSGSTSDADRTTREGRIMVLAGLAGLGETVLAELRAMALDDLTIREWLWLALGLAAAGDENGARDIERRCSTSTAAARPVGPPRVGNDHRRHRERDGRLLLVLSARLGEPFARDVAAYLSSTRSRASALSPWRCSPTSRRCSNGCRRTSDAVRLDDRWRASRGRLDPGGSITIVVTPEQRAAFGLEPVEGKHWRGDVIGAAPGRLPSGDLVGDHRADDHAGPIRRQRGPARPRDDHGDLQLQARTSAGG